MQLRVVRPRPISQICATRRIFSTCFISQCERQSNADEHKTEYANVGENHIFAPKQNSTENQFCQQLEFDGPGFRVPSSKLFTAFVPVRSSFSNCGDDFPFEPRRAEDR